MPGGGEIHLFGGEERFEIDLEGGGNSPVTITSGDPGNPVTVSQIDLESVSNLTVTGLNVDSTGVSRSGWDYDLDILDSENITISDVTFTSNASGRYDPDDPEAVLGETLGLIAHSSGVTFADNHVSGYFHGLSVGSSDNVTVRGNEITELQGDGIRLAGVQNVQIEDNHLHNFYGAPYGFNHGDMIQIYSNRATEPTHDVTISGNIIDSGSGTGSQSIFIRNEQYDTGQNTDYIYENLTITNNLIYNSHVHGITVGHADGVVVSGNTILHNLDAGEQPPQIITGNSWNVTVENNILPLQWNSDPEGDPSNLYLDYENEQAENYVGNHIVDAFAGGDATLADLRLRADSDAVGKGADATDPLTQTEGGVEPVVVFEVDPEDPQTVTFDASLSVDETGAATTDDYVFQWTMSDGTVRYGAEVTHTFFEGGAQTASLTVLSGTTPVASDTTALEVGGRELVVLDFDQGFEDLSSYDSELLNNGAEWTGDTMRIGGNEYFQVLNSNEQIHNLGAFNLSMDMSLREDNAAGHLFQMGSTLIGEVRADGQFKLRLETDEGRFDLASAVGALQEGVNHNITVDYSDTEGLLSLSIDGTEVASIAASGVTPSDGASLVVGSPFKTVVNADVEAVTFSTGVDPSEPKTGKSVYEYLVSHDLTPAEADQDKASADSDVVVAKEKAGAGDTPPAPLVLQTEAEAEAEASEEADAVADAPDQDAPAPVVTPEQDAPEAPAVTSDVAGEAAKQDALSPQIGVELPKAALAPVEEAPEESPQADVQEEGQDDANGLWAMIEAFLRALMGTESDTSTQTTTAAPEGEAEGDPAGERDTAPDIGADMGIALGAEIGAADADVTDIDAYAAWEADTETELGAGLDAEPELELSMAADMAPADPDVFETTLPGLDQVGADVFIFSLPLVEIPVEDELDRQMDAAAADEGFFASLLAG